MKITLALLFFMMQPAWSIRELKSLPSAGKVEFEATGRPSMLKIIGTGEGVTAKIQLNENKISGEIIFQMATLKTGIEMRDEHMHEKYLQSKQYPEAKLVFKDFQMPAGWSLQNPLMSSSTFRAKLLLHGVEQEITGQYSIESMQLKTKAKFDIKLTDFKIPAPVYLGVKVADIIKTEVTIDSMNLNK